MDRDEEDGEVFAFSRCEVAPLFDFHWSMSGALKETTSEPVKCSHAPVNQATAKGYYSRLFGRPAHPITFAEEEKLIELGNAMRYEVEQEGTLTVRIGYTYFGQFLGHDLSYDGTPLGGPYLEPEKTPNFRTPSFDLDHVYGNGPEGSPYLYEGEEGAETFKIGATVPAGYRRDLPVQHGQVLIGDLKDTRNLDNLLLRQIHVVFLKFHNEAIRQLQSNEELANAAESLGHTLFERARRLVCWHYQWIIRHDYLPRILHNDAWHNQNDRVPRRPGTDFRVPIEFSVAAFRFGHSMVRNAYRLNCRRKRVVIEQLMALGQQAAPIQDDYLVEWGTFFDGLPTSGPQASSNYIDSSLSRAMHGLSAGTIRLANELEAIDPSDLAVRTLLRGARAQLASGQEVAAALVAEERIKPNHQLTGLELSRDSNNTSGSVLKRNALENRTPLFYYILKEAELKGGGITLGPVGSHIAFEVIQSAIEADQDSYLSKVGPKWKLPRWRFPNGSQRPINSLIGIVQLVGDDKLLPECEAQWRRYQTLPEPA